MDFANFVRGSMFSKGDAGSSGGFLSSYVYLEYTTEDSPVLRFDGLRSGKCGSEPDMECHYVG